MDKGEGERGFSRQIFDRVNLLLIQLRILQQSCLVFVEKAHFEREKVNRQNDDVTDPHKGGKQ